MEEHVSLDKSVESIQVLATKVSLWGSIILFLISAVIGIMVDSITLILDASGSLVILLVTVLMHFSLKKMHKPPDEYFNFGYGKYEPLTVTLQGGLMIATCVVSAGFAIQDIIHGDNIHNYVLPVIGMFIAGIIGAFITVFIKSSAKKTGSSILHTAGMHWMLDTMLSFGVCAGFFAGLMLERLGFNKATLYFDPVMAILLAIILVRVPVKTIIKNIMELLDAAPGEDIQAKLKKVVEEYKPKVFRLHRLRSRKAGEKIFVDVCFLVKSDMRIIEAENIAVEFEKDVIKHLPHGEVIVSFKPAK